MKFYTGIKLGRGWKLITMSGRCWLGYYLEIYMYIVSHIDRCSGLMNLFILQVGFYFSQKMYLSNIYMNKCSYGNFYELIYIIRRDRTNNRLFPIKFYKRVKFVCFGFFLYNLKTNSFLSFFQLITFNYNRIT